MGGPMREWRAARILRMMPSASGDNNRAAATFSKQSRKLLMSQAVIAPLRRETVAAVSDRRASIGDRRYNAAPGNARRQAERRSALHPTTAPSGHLQNLRPGINPDFLSLSIHRLQALRTGETGVQTPQRNRYVRDVCLEDHGGQRLQVRIGWGTHSPPIRPVITARQHKVDGLAPRRLDHRHPNSPRRYRLLDLRTNRALGKGGETLAHQP